MPNKEELPDHYWSSDVELVCEALRNNAAVMSEYHKKNMWYFKNQLKYYKIPVIVISGFNSVIAVGLQPYMDQSLISATTCLLALICGIIGSIELFLGIADGAEKEQKAATDFYLLSIDIYKTLTLERTHRAQSGRDYLEEKYSQYTNLFANAQLLKKKVKDKLTHIPPPTTNSGFYTGGNNSSSNQSETSFLDIEEGKGIELNIPDTVNQIGLDYEEIRQNLKQTGNVVTQEIKKPIDNGLQNLKQKGNVVTQEIKQHVDDDLQHINMSLENKGKKTTQRLTSIKEEKGEKH
jgi:hypothetical protein